MKGRVLLCVSLCLLLGGCAGEPAVPVTPEEPAVSLPQPLPAEREPTPQPQPGGIKVRTDWSALGEREMPQPVGARWYEEYTPALITRDDYGQLMPYAGLRLWDNWPAEDGCLYGLMTMQGVLVTDPVYSAVYAPGYDEGNGWQSLPLLVLTQGEPIPGEGGIRTRLAVAAADGSWCTGLDYCYIRAGKEQLVLLSETGLTVMTLTGEITTQYTPQRLGMTDEAFGALLSELSWGDSVGGWLIGNWLSLQWADEEYTTIRYCDLATGEVYAMLAKEWYALEQQSYQQGSWTIAYGEQTTTLTRKGEDIVIPYSDSTSYGYAQVQGELVLFPNSGAVYTLDGRELFPGGEDFRVEYVTDSLLGDRGGGLLLRMQVGSEDALTRFYRTDGTHLPLLDGWGLYGSEQWYRSMSLTGGLIELLDLNTATYYDLDTLTCVFRTYLGYTGD